MNTLALALALVAYNSGMNRLPAFHGRLYVPLNLALSAAALILGILALDLDRPALGLGSGQGGGLVLGVVLGALAAAPALLSLRAGAASVLADDRLADITWAHAAYRALIRVPLGTALPEELLFRGVLYGALASQMAPVPAALWSSLAFGLWHITPTHNLLRENGLTAGRSRTAVALPVAAGVVLTAVAGVALVWLRIATGGLAAPFALHATVNSLGTVAAHLANRRER